MLEKLVLASVITFSLNLFLGGHLGSNHSLSNTSQLTTSPAPEVYTLTAQADARE
jgi:hypothetical protein